MNHKTRQDKTRQDKTRHLVLTAAVALIYSFLAFPTKIHAQPQPLALGASISGKVYNDHNGDRAYQVGEELLSSWQVWLYKGGTPVATTTTGADGQYSFTALDAGDYSLNIAVMLPGYILTSPADPMGPGMQSVSLGANEHNPNIDFGVNGPAGIWRTSGSIPPCSDPSSGGRLWYETDFDDGAWTQITPPDAGWGCNGCSRSYRYDFVIGSPSDLDSAKVYFVSDDGSRLFVNGQHVQDYHGCNICCVNIPPPTCSCGIDTLPAVRIDSLLQPGKNVVSIQVTDVNGRSFFYAAVRLHPKVSPPGCDTIQVAGAQAITAPGGVGVPIHLKSCTEIGGGTVPLKYSQLPAGWTCDSASFVGSRLEGCQPLALAVYPDSQKIEVSFACNTCLTAGSGLLFYVWFSNNGTCTKDYDTLPRVQICLDTTTIGVPPPPPPRAPKQLKLGDCTANELTPAFVAGCADVPGYRPICFDDNCDCFLDVLDVICVISDAFRGGHCICIMSQADWNCDGVPTVLDVVAAIDCIFRGGDCFKCRCL